MSALSANRYVLISCVLYALSWTKKASSDELQLKEINTPLREPETTHIYQVKDRLYWPLNKPVWLRIAESPDETAKSYLIQELSHVNQAMEQDIIENGLKLDVEGAQFVRWVNIVTKSQYDYHFTADGLPPSVKVSYLNAPAYSDNNVKHFGKGLAVTFSATDTQSGVEAIYHSIDGRPYEIYGKALTFQAEARYTIFYWAKDYVGYQSPVSKDTFQVDLTPPVSQVSTSNDQIEGNLSPRSKIYITAQDKLSGVASIHYRFADQEEYRVYQNEVNLGSLSDGENFLDFYSIDKVSNQENFQSYHFYLDKTPPTVSYTFVGPNHKVGNDMYVARSALVALTATDSRVEVKSLRYRFGESNLRDYKNPLSLVDYKGKVSLSYTATDALDNEGPLQTVSFIIDESPPDASFELLGPQYEAKNKVVFISSKSQLRLKANDTQAGVDVISYQIAESPDQIYKQPITIGAEGRFMVRYWAKDHVDNLGRVQDLLLVVDNSPPKIFPLFDTQKLGDIENEKQRYQSYAVGTAMILNAADNASGIAKISYTLNGKEFQEYKQKVPLKQAGFYSIKVKATDRVGNTSEKDLLIHIKDPKHA